MTRSQRRIEPPTDLHVGNGHTQTIEATWYAIQHDIEVTECCACGLVHETEYKLERGRIWWRSRVNVQATVAARKAQGVVGIRIKKI